MAVEIPDKRYFKIGEVAKMAGVATHVLRYWENEFNDIKPKRAGSKQRLYRREDVERILVIKDLLHRQGYTISGAKKLIETTTDKKNIATRSPEMTDTAEKLGFIKKDLLDLEKLLSS
ncbi:MAG: MerR family transcriptional regulator [Proteobacteria bacterium]|nr:MAG: MerR family transcriptional regulator [Pseudomonadota bacterium]